MHGIPWARRRKGREQAVTSALAQARGHSHGMWFLADVIGLFPINVGPFSRNVVPRVLIFSANVVPKRPM